MIATFGYITTSSKERNPGPPIHGLIVSTPNMGTPRMEAVLDEN
jgi:hypothetical protein